MIALEMLGYYSDDPGSQDYGSLSNIWKDCPLPTQGDFVAFVSNPHSKNFLNTCVAAYNNTDKPFPMVPISPIPME